MILPGKHLKHDRALLGIGSEILAALEEERTVSELWELVQQQRAERANPLSFDWFILSLSFLFTIGAVRLDDYILTRVRPE
jgi:hypothetical protein